MVTDSELTTPILVKYQKLYDDDPRSKVFAPLAEIYRKLGMKDRALEILREGIKQNPSYVLGYLGLAAYYFEENKFQLCYSTLRPFVSENRDNLRLHILQGT